MPSHGVCRNGATGGMLSITVTRSCGDLTRLPFYLPVQSTRLDREPLDDHAILLLKLQHTIRWLSICDFQKIYPIFLFCISALVDLYFLYSSLQPGRTGDLFCPYGCDRLRQGPHRIFHIIFGVVHAQSDPQTAVRKLLVISER